MNRVRLIVCAFALAACRAGGDELPAWSPGALALRVPADATVAAGEPVRVLLIATAPAGQVAALTAETVPPGATFGDRGDGTAYFFWTPATAQAGRHAVAVVAAAGGARLRKTFTLTVTAAGDPGGDGSAGGAGDPPADPPQDPPPGPENEAPTLASAVIVSESYTRAHPMRAVPAGYADPESAPPAYLTLWFVDGRAVTGETDLVLGPEHFARGQTVSAQVFPLDGDRIGAPAGASAALVLDAPPAIAAAALSGAPFTAGRPVRAAASGWYDLDGDAPVLTYRWFVDGAAVPVTASELAGGWFVRGATVAVEVTPWSGGRAGRAVRSAAAPIENTPPASPAVHIRAHGVKWDTPSLAVEIDRPAADADGDPVAVHYTWYRNGLPFAEGVSQPVVAGELRQGDVWRVEVTSGDGLAAGPVTHAELTVDLRRVRALALGSAHACALLNEGLVKCWGSNAFGQLGHNLGTGNYATPQLVMNQSANVVAVAARTDHTCALTDAGRVRCWGNNAGGQVGAGTRGGSYATPQDVAGLPPAAGVAVGAAHSCAWTASGSVYCWGDNAAGQLGLGAVADALYPTRVAALAEPIAFVAAGAHHTCALARAGRVWCWGSNASGQLGADLTAGQSPLPVSVASLSVVTEVGAGGDHTCARNASGDVWCWGNNTFGQLGNGDSAVLSSSVPRLVPGASAALLALGSQHTCAAAPDGSARCWGASAAHQLGTGTAVAGATASPQVVRALSGASGLAAGGAHTCALTRGGAVKCWGSAANGQIGEGTIGGSVTAPTGVTSLRDVGVAAVAAGGEHTCALSMAGAVKCWGRGDAGQLGDGTGTNRGRPVDAFGLQDGVVQIEAGDAFTCARTAAGAVKCWGSDANGSLGNDAAIVAAWQPVGLAVAPPVKKISLGSTHGCAVSVSDVVYCWGATSDGWVNFSAVPTPFNAAYFDAAAGGNHTCILRRPASGGGLLCSGRNDFGQLGDGTRTSTLGWVVASASNGWGELALGWLHSCARMGGALYCWGNGWAGAVGQGGYGTWSSPVRVLSAPGVNLAGVTSAAAGLERTCAVTAMNLQCFGGAYVGDGTPANAVFPTAVLGGVTAVSVSRGAVAGGTRGHACAVDDRQSLYCWGNNGYGQLGRSGLAALAPEEAFLSAYWW